MVSLSKVREGIMSDGLDANRGLRLVGNKLKTRDRTQGREWNPIGRLLHQTAAVELVERAIDDALGRPGEGRKLLKEMGGVYRMIGARITPEQVEKVRVETARRRRAQFPDKEGTEAPRIRDQARIGRWVVLPKDEPDAEDARLRALAFSGQAVTLLLAAEDDKAARREVLNDLKYAMQAQTGVDPEFEKDGHRLEIRLMDEEGEIRNVYADLKRAKLEDGHANRFVITALAEFLTELGEPEDIGFKRAFYLSTLVNQRTIGSVHIRFFMTLGEPVRHQTNNAWNIQKFRDEAGRLHYGMRFGSLKTAVETFNTNDLEPKQMDKESSFYFEEQDFEISADDLARGNSDGLIVHPAELTLKMKLAEL